MAPDEGEMTAEELRLLICCTIVGSLIALIFLLIALL